MLLIGALVATVVGVCGLWVVHRLGLVGQLRDVITQRLSPPNMENRDRVLGTPAQQHVNRDGQALVLSLALWPRLVFTLCIVAVLAVANLQPDDLPRGRFWESYMILSALAAWVVGYVWTYQVILDGPRLLLPTWLFTSRALDLRKLDRVEDQGSLMLVLHMKGGNRVRLPKLLRNRATLMRALAVHATP
ncbi:MAG: hypothetical protein MK180_11165 [Rhodobacteraceae bacterium]|nr:hypothetical protein [Paracoccaceae bacterium]